MNHKFPKYLHLPVKIANKVEIEDLIIGVSIFLIGFISIWVVWIVGVFAILKYIKAKKNNPRGFLCHWMMKLGIKVVQYYPPLLETRFIE
ncbi:MAG: hypothetical protein ABFD82_04130 [Syntrophaceae bacterium]